VGAGELPADAGEKPPQHGGTGEPMMHDRVLFRMTTSSTSSYVSCARFGFAFTCRSTSSFQRLALDWTVEEKTAPETSRSATRRPLELEHVLPTFRYRPYRVPLPPVHQLTLP